MREGYIDEIASDGYANAGRLRGCQHGWERGDSAEEPFDEPSRVGVDGTHDGGPRDEGGVVQLDRQSG